jgi:hypothetical protein
MRSDKMLLPLIKELLERLEDYGETQNDLFWLLETYGFDEKEITKEFGIEKFR